MNDERERLLPNEQILISVIVPVYNCEKSLNLTVDSLLMQTYQNIEIILVDDGAKDGSGYLCDQYAQKDKRITVVHQNNRGGANARNTGIRTVQGEYISFVDAGDYVEHNIYESLIPYVEANIDLIDFPFYTKNHSGRFDSICKVEKNMVFSRNFIEREMMPCLLNIKDNPIINNPPICFMWKYLYKKSIVNDNHLLLDEKRKKWQDKGFVLKYVDCCESIIFYDKPLITYVCSDTQNHLSASYFRNLVFLIIEQREGYQKKYGSKYSFETNYYYVNSISIIMGRIEEIVYNENKETAKALIEQVFEKKYVQKLAQWQFTNDEKMSQYQNLIKSNDINGTYLLMQQQIENKKKALVRQKKVSAVNRVKRKAKNIVRPLYNKIKSGQNA